MEKKKEKKLDVTEGEVCVRHILENLLGLLLLNIKIRFLISARILTFEASGHDRYIHAKYQIILPVIVLLKCDVVQSTNSVNWLINESETWTKGATLCEVYIDETSLFKPHSSLALLFIDSSNDW